MYFIFALCIGTLGACSASFIDEVTGSLYKEFLLTLEEGFISETALYAYLQEPLMVQGYFNFGFREKGMLFGISVGKKTANNTKNKIAKEFSQGLASRNIIIPILLEYYQETGLPDALLEDYLLFQIIYEVEFKVSKTFRISPFESKNYVGCVYIVSEADVSFSESVDDTAFIRNLLQDIKAFSMKDKQPYTLQLFEYSLANAERLGFSYAQQWQMLLYSAAIHLNSGSMIKAKECFAFFPENLLNLWNCGVFDDEDFLLIGDLYIIFGNQTKAFSSWTYGLQLNPQNKTIKERIKKYRQ